MAKLVGTVTIAPVMQIVGVRGLCGFTDCEWRSNLFPVGGTECERLAEEHSATHVEGEARS